MAGQPLCIIHAIKTLQLCTISKLMSYAPKWALSRTILTTSLLLQFMIAEQPCGIAESLDSLERAHLGA